MNIQLAARVHRIKPSPTLAVSARAASLRVAGKDVIDLGSGEPDFDTPNHIKEAAIAAIHSGQTKYTAVAGTPALRAAVQKKFSRDNKLEYNLDQILVSVGGKQSFYNLAQAFLESGDEVIIPAPYWVSYPDIVLLADAIPVIVEAGIEQRYKILPSQLEAAISDKTKLFVINSPSNPSGVAYTGDELRALAKVLLKYPKVMIATDDMYEKILWGQDTFVNILNVCPELYDRTIVLNGVSKAYAMTGWRIGFAAGPVALIQAMTKVQSQSTSNPCSIAQAAAAAALSGPQDCLLPMVQAFHERHDAAFKAINAVDGMKVIAADGAFYSFPDCTGLIQRFGVSDDTALAELLLERALVAVVPGSAFGAKNCLRFSHACAEHVFAEALNRIARLADA